MSETRHERPGVYSAYDAAAVVSAAKGSKTIGVAAKAVRGTVGEVVTLTGYAAGVTAFGEDADPGMSTLLRLLFLGGAGKVVAVRVADEGTLEDYQAAFDALAKQDVQVVLCDSAALTVQQALRSAVEAASAQRRERIAVVGGDGDTVAELVERAAGLNSERMVLVGPDALNSSGGRLPGVFAAAAVAAAIAAGKDPAVPLNGTELYGLGGLVEEYGDNDIDLLVRGGGRHLAGADYHPGSGRPYPHRAGGAAQQVQQGQEQRQEPGGHPLPDDRGAGEKGGGGDHRQLRRGDGHRRRGRPHRLPGGVQLCRGPRPEPDLSDGAYHRLTRERRTRWK